MSRFPGPEARGGGRAAAPWPLLLLLLAACAGEEGEATKIGDLIGEDGVEALNAAITDAKSGQLVIEPVDVTFGENGARRMYRGARSGRGRRRNRRCSNSLIVAARVLKGASPAVLCAVAPDGVHGRCRRAATASRETRHSRLPCSRAAP